MKIKHPKLKNVKKITESEITLIINDQEIVIPLNEIDIILKDIKFARDLLSSYRIHNLIMKNTDNYQYYHNEIRDNVAKYLI